MTREEGLIKLDDRFFIRSRFKLNANGEPISAEIHVTTTEPFWVHKLSDYFEAGTITRARNKERREIDWRRPFHNDRVLYQVDQGAPEPRNEFQVLGQHERSARVMYHWRVRKSDDIRRVLLKLREVRVKEGGSDPGLFTQTRLRVLDDDLKKLASIGAGKSKRPPKGPLSVLMNDGDREKELPVIERRHYDNTEYRN